MVDVITNYSLPFKDCPKCMYFEPDVKVLCTPEKLETVVSVSCRNDIVCINAFHIWKGGQNEQISPNT